MIDVEVLQLALTQEEAAIKTYQQLAEQYPNLRDLLYFLVVEEQKHRSLLQKKIAELCREN
ncbi:MAG: hypothetical protein HQL24_04525 [Candidatus Omnitrophica bacterium]|nr:hypothetical protein [Candidatus Omnitrophota bacterium]